MNTTERKFTILTASEGHTITDDRGTLSKEVWLAVNDTPDRWREITDDEADALRQAAEAQAQAALNNAEEEDASPSDTPSTSPENPTEA